MLADCTTTCRNGRTAGGPGNYCCVTVSRVTANCCLSPPLLRRPERWSKFVSGRSTTLPNTLLINVLCSTAAAESAQVINITHSRRRQASTATLNCYAHLSGRPYNWFVYVLQRRPAGVARSSTSSVTSCSATCGSSQPAQLWQAAATLNHHL